MPAGLKPDPPRIADTGGSLLTRLGQIAGVGGIALGVLLILFRGFIQESLSHVDPSNAARLLQLFLLFTFAVTVIGLLVWASQVKMARAMLFGLLLFATAVCAGAYFMVQPKSTGVFQVRVIVLSPQRLPVENARVWSTIGGEAARVSGGWQFDIPESRKPADGVMKVFAEEPTSFTRGENIVRLGEQQIISTEIVLAKDTSAKVRGIVVDRSGKAVAGARVSVVGYGGESVVTGPDGDFALDAHASEGQMVRVHAERTGHPPTSQDHPAGQSALTLVLK